MIEGGTCYNKFSCPKEKKSITKQNVQNGREKKFFFIKKYFLSLFILFCILKKMLNELKVSTTLICMYGLVVYTLQRVNLVWHTCSAHSGFLHAVLPEENKDDLLWVFADQWTSSSCIPVNDVFLSDRTACAGLLHRLYFVSVSWKKRARLAVLVLNENILIADWFSVLSNLVKKS